MIIGSGLLAKAFEPRHASSEHTWIYAAGVSNSGCTGIRDFEREKLRLSEALHAGMAADAFVYFSTCSVADPKSARSPYVLHKKAMEGIVRTHPRYLVARLPQVAGRTPNPHTLLNYLYARISRSEAFPVWVRATRNIIDVEDVARIVDALLAEPSRRCTTVNVANPVSHPIMEIVAAMEKSVGKEAVTRLVDDGAPYEIDTSEIGPIVERLGLCFDGDYLLKIARKYYARGALP